MKSSRRKHRGVAEKWSGRLFNKNTALCKLVEEEVYGVMPAQCQKVNRRCQSFGMKR